MTGCICLYTYIYIFNYIHTYIHNIYNICINVCIPMYHDITSMKSSQIDLVRTICCDVWMFFVSSTHIGLAFTFASFAIFMLRLSPDTICTAPDGQVPSQAPSFHRESRSTRGDGDFGNSTGTSSRFLRFYSTGTCSGQTPCGRARKRGSEKLLFLQRPLQAATFWKSSVFSTANHVPRCASHHAGNRGCFAATQLGTCSR